MTTYVTHRQREVLAAVAAHLKKRGYPPTVRELCNAVGVLSSSTIQQHLTRLIVKGYLTRPPHSPRALVVTDLGKTYLTGDRVDDGPVFDVTLFVRVRAGTAPQAVERARAGLGELVEAHTTEIVKGGNGHEKSGNGGSPEAGSGEADDPETAPRGQGTNSGAA